MTDSLIHPTRAIVHLDALTHNLDVVRSCVGPKAEILAVVKAEAYGHGMIPVARYVLGHGASMLGVARIQESRALREAGVSAPTLVFEVCPQEFLPTAVRAGIDLTVVSVAGGEQISAVAKQVGLKQRVQFKVDTGMSRLGFPFNEAVARISSVCRLPGIEIAGIYSHFATSEDPDQSFALLQLERFNEVLHGLQKTGIEFPLRHMANSGAILTLPQSHFDMVRPGIMMYGYPPGRAMLVTPALRPVLSLHSRVSMVKRVEAGTTVSYGRRFRAEAPTKIATIPVGYADGYSRLLTNRGSVLIDGKKYPIAGTVCMDHLMVDVGPDSEIEPGVDVVLIGSSGSESISGWDIAALMGTIPYEVTCLITPRVVRLYKD
jgi:alanine racemase